METKNMVTDEKIDFAIQALQRRIDQNERLQDEWIASHGEINDSLQQKHDDLLDQMENLCRQRRNIL